MEPQEQALEDHLEEKNEVLQYDETGKDTEQTDHLVAWTKLECHGRRRIQVW